MATRSRRTKRDAPPFIAAAELDAWQLRIDQATRDGWLARIVEANDHRAIARGCWYDAEAGARPAAFMRELVRHSVGRWAGRPFNPLPWQVAMLDRLFGWRRADGTRRFRRAFVFVPKKNGKSSLSAAIALYLLAADGEAAAEVYSVAASRDQAGIVFSESMRMVKGSPALSSALDVIPSTRRILYGETSSVYSVLSSDASTAEGRNAHAVIFDELHAQRDRTLFDALRYAGAARAQPLFLSITTAGDDLDTICGEEYAYAKQVQDGTADDIETFALVYEAPAGADPMDEATWRAANPSLGATMTLESFAADAREAATSPAKMQRFRRYRLNIWVESGGASMVPIDRWDACAAVGLAPESRPIVHGGLDLSATTDTTALVLCAGEYDTDDTDGIVRHQIVRATFWPFIWLPDEGLADRMTRDGVPWAEWARLGYVRLTEGPVVDYERIRKTIAEEVRDRYQLVEVAHDRWGARDLAQRLTGDGVQMVEFGQGYRDMSNPTKLLIRLVAQSAVTHDGNPAYRWQIGNAVVTQDDADNLKPNKRKSRKRIDAVVASIMALARSAENPAPQADIGGLYESRGVMFL